MKKLLILAALLFCPALHATTCTATTTSAADVQTALTACAGGGTVVIPASSGVTDWGSTQVTLTMTGAVTIQGATACSAGCSPGSGGVGLAFNDNSGTCSGAGTCIKLSYSSGGEPFQITGCSATNFLTLSNITFIVNSANTSGSLNINCGNATYNQVGIRLHHIHFLSSVGSCVPMKITSIWGLIDHYLYDDTVGSTNSCAAFAVEGDHASVGAKNWALASNPVGTNNCIIVEDFSFNYTNPSTEGTWDAYSGACVTERYGIVTGNQIGGGHGTDSGYLRSVLSAEVYNLTINSCPKLGGSNEAMMNTRGGVLLFYNNTFTSNLCTAILLQYLRASGQASSQSWGTWNQYINWTPASTTSTNSLSDVVTVSAADWQASHSYTCSASSPCIIGPGAAPVATGSVSGSTATFTGTFATAWASRTTFHVLGCSGSSYNYNSGSGTPVFTVSTANATTITATFTGSPSGSVSSCTLTETGNLGIGSNIPNSGGFNYMSTSNCTSNGTEPASWGQTFYPPSTVSDNTCTWTNIGGGASPAPGSPGTNAGFKSGAPDTSCSTGVDCTYYVDGAGTHGGTFAGGYPPRDCSGCTGGQVVYGSYAWNNSGSGLPNPMIVADSNLPAGLITLNTDFFLTGPPAGYTPYTYPDPLQGAPAPGTTIQGVTGTGVTIHLF